MKKYVAIRKAEASEHDKIMQIAKRSKYTKDFSNQVMFSSQAAYDKGWIRVAFDPEHPEEILGFVCVREKVRTPETVIYFIGVNPVFSQHGIGTALLESVMHVYKHKCIVLNVAKDNEGARRFYEKRNFQVTGESLGGTGLALKLEW